MSKRLLSRLLIAIPLTLLLSTVSVAQVSVASTAGTPAAIYATLGASFTAINTGVHQGIIDITLTGNTIETVSASLDSSGNPTGSSYTNIIIKPQAATAVTVSGSITGSLITLNGADNVSINGLNTGGASLTFQNTGSGTSTATLKLINDASSNKFYNTTFKGGSNTSTTLGAVVFISTGLATGNDRNGFFNCNIDGVGLQASCLLSSGTYLSSSYTQNSNDTLQNCNFYDYFNPSTTSPIGVNISSGNTDWYIGGNSLYQTVGRTTTAQGIHTGLQTIPAWATDTHLIENNFVGGNAPGAVGTMTYAGSSTNVVGFIGYSIQTGGPGNMVQNNTCQNVTLSYASAVGSFGNAGLFIFIGGYDGTTTVTGNTVKNLSFSNTLGAILGSGINPNGRVTTASTTVKPTFYITNNTIDNLLFNGTTSQYYGIRLETSSGNTLGSSTTTISNPYFVVTGNTITNLNITTAALSNWVRGIGTLATNGSSSTVPLWPKALIENNSIHDINSNSTLASYTTMTAVGVQIAGSLNSNNTVDTFFINKNTIYNINATNTGSLSNMVAGIQSTNSNVYINGNKIYGLSNASSGGTPVISGVNVRAVFVGQGNILNNYIALGAGNTNNISYFGVLNNFSASAPINVYNNSILIAGTDAGANTLSSSCLHRATEIFGSGITTTFNVRNNLLVNSRTGGTGSYYAMSTQVNTGLSSNYNALIASNASAIAWYNAAVDFNGWKSGSSNDNGSVSLVTGASSDFTITPSVISTADLFNDASAATNGTLDIKTTNNASWIVNGKAVALSSVSADKAGNARSIVLGVATDIGAHEFTTATTPPNLVESGSFSNAGTTTYTSFGRAIASVLWNNVGTVSSRSFKFYPGTNPLLAGSPNYSNGYWDLAVNGGASGYNYDVSLNYDASFLGTAPNTASTRITNTTVGNMIVASSANNTTLVATAIGQTAFSKLAITDIWNYIWAGATSINWTTAANWSPVIVPPTGAIVSIPSGTTFAPTSNGLVSLNDLTVASGVTFTNTGLLNVTGTLDNNGSITGSTNLNGTAAQTVLGTGTVLNMTLNNAAGASILSGSNKLNIKGSLNLTSGTLITNGNLVLKSDALGTGKISTITGGAISGTATVETYIPGGTRAFRFLGHPFSDALNMNSLIDNVFITGAVGVLASVSGFDSTSNKNPSAYWYDNTVPALGAWTAFTSTSDNSWTQYRGVRVLVRGDRTQTTTLAGANPTPLPVTLDVSGTLNTGNANIALPTAGAYHFISNPYPSPTDIGTVVDATLNIGTIYWVWKASTAPRGAYVPLTVSSGAYNLAMSGAFIVKPTASTTLAFTETNKQASVSDNLFRNNNSSKLLELELQYNNDYADKLFVGFNKDAKATKDAKDGDKLMNQDINFYALAADNTKLTLDARPLVDGTVVPLGFTTTIPSTYKVKVLHNGLETGVEVYLKDKLMNTLTKLVPDAEYRFDVIAGNAASQGENRFELVQKAVPVIATLNSVFTVKVSPNPVVDILNINYEGLNDKAATSIRITDMNGKIVRSIEVGKISAGSQILNIKGFSNGLYTVQLINGENKQVQNIIKN